MKNCNVIWYKKYVFLTIVVVIVAVVLTISFLIKSKEKTPPQILGTGKTTHEYVEFELLHGELKNGVPYIEVQWQNDTAHNVCFGEEYKIYKGEELVEPKREQYWLLILNVLQPHKGRTEEFTLTDYDLKENTAYRLEKEFYFEEEPDEKHKAYVEFYIDDNKDLKGTLFMGENVVFENGVYSSVIYTDENMPQFLVSNNVLYIDEKTPIGGQISYWYKAGKLEKIDLKSETLGKGMSAIGWDDGYSEKQLIANNATAYKAENPDTNRIYYLLEQKNGDIFITYGYTDTENIRWIFKVKKSKESIGDTDINTNPYFNAKVLEVYDDAVLVEPFKGEETSPDTDRIIVSKNVISTNPVPELKVGSEIRIVYNGEILEIYPATLGKVFAIYEME